MKVNFLQELKDLEGNVLTEPKGVDKKDEPITLKDLCANALVNSMDGEEKDKLRKYELALDIAKALKPVDITAEDVVLIKKSLNKYPPLYFGQACHMLEGKPENSK